jgi:hypothetical protein
MRRILALLVMVFATALPVQAQPVLRLEASIARDTYFIGERFTITTRLFNDGDAAIRAGVLIEDDGTFLRISPPYDKPPTVQPGTSVPFRFSYQVLPSTPIGLHAFILRVYPTNETKIVTVRVPEHHSTLYLPLVVANST